MTKIFVGNLPAGVTNGDLQALFENYGVMTDCAVLGSFGFVHMSSEHEAKAAVNALNRSDLFGSRLRVELSTPATRGKMKSEGITAVKIFVGNLAHGTTDSQVREIFESYGSVTEAVVIGGYGFVHMSNSDEAKVAIKDLNGFKLNNQPISVELSTKDTQGKAKGGEGSAPQFDRPRGGAVWGSVRGRGRGITSTRFDPYSAHAGAGGWMGRADPYAAGNGDVYIQGDPYRQLTAPPSAMRGPPVAAVSSASATGGEDASFARDLLKLYTENPVAFDAYARDPIVRRSLKLDSQTQVLATPEYDEGLNGEGDYYQEPRGPPSRLLNPALVSSYGSGIMAVQRRGGGLRQSGSMVGYRPTQSQLYMSFE